MAYGSLRPDSYYDRSFRQGSSLQRARRPYLFRNAATGVGLVMFITGVYVYTLRAIGTDDFEDVKPANMVRDGGYRES